MPSVQEKAAAINGLTGLKRRLEDRDMDRGASDDDTDEEDESPEEPPAKPQPPLSSSPKDVDLSDLFHNLKIAKTKALISQAKKGDDLVEKSPLNRTYLEEMPYSKELVDMLKKAGCRWEPLIKHWWATEKALKNRGKLFGVFTEHKLTGQQKSTLKSSYGAKA